jgi:hypothetical protein
MPTKALPLAIKTLLGTHQLEDKYIPFPIPPPSKGFQFLNSEPWLTCYLIGNFLQGISELNKPGIIYKQIRIFHFTARLVNESRMVIVSGGWADKETRTAQYCA